MTLRRLLTTFALATVATPALATSSMCIYSPGDSSGYELEFIGYEKVSMIQVSLPSGPRSLPGGSYKVLAFDERTSKVHLVYRNPNDPSLPPSFVLKGAGKNVRMFIGQEQFVGELSCDY